MSGPTATMGRHPTRHARYPLHTASDLVLQVWSQTASHESLYTQADCRQFACRGVSGTTAGSMNITISSMYSTNDTV